MALLNQTKFIQPIRSNSAYTSSTEAMSAINSLLTELNGNEKADGVKFAAKYDNNGKQTWLYGLYNASAKNFTFFDASVENINAIKGDIINLQEAIGEGGSVEEQIKTAIQALDSDATSTDGAFVNVKVTLTDGKVSAVNVTESDIASAALLGTASDAATDETAFGKIAANAAAIANEAQDRAKAITDAINALDAKVGSQTIADGKHVAVEVVETDGKLTSLTVVESDIASADALDDEITRATGAEEALGGRLDVIEGKAEGSIKKAVADLKSALEGELGETDAKTLAALNDRIDTAVDNAKSYSVTKVTEGLGANVKEAYKLVDEDGIQSGELIPVYKDSALQSAVLGTATVNEKEQDCLILTYLDVNGGEQVVNIPLGDFLRESEFKAGLQVVNGEVSVKIAEDSESFLTVDVNGVKLSGIADAIDADVLVETNRAKAAEDKIEASIGLANDGSYVTTTGNYTSEATTIAGAIAALDTQAKANADAIADLDGETVKNINVNGVSGNVANNIASLTIDGGDVSLPSDYVAVKYPTTTTVEFTPVTSESTIDEAIKQVDSSVSQLVGEVLKNEATVAAALTKIKESAGFDENAELTYQDTNYLNSAADLKSADVALDAEIKKLNVAIGALDSTKTGNGTHVDVTINQVDGKITEVTVTEDFSNIDCGTFE